MEKKRYILVILLLVGLMFDVSKVLAEDSGIDFNVGIEPSEFQYNQAVSYYDLKLEPSQKTEIAVLVANNSDQEAVFEIELNTAITNDNGIIDYTQRENEVKNFDDSLKYKFSDIATITSNKITIPAKQQARVPIQLVMPKEKFDGIILGGIYILKSVETDKSAKEGYSNRYSLVKGVVLRETDEVIKPEISLSRVTKQVKDFRGEICAILRNPQPINISKLNIRGKITNQKTGKVISKVNAENRDMAPNSSFAYQFDFKDKSLPIGNFLMEVVAADDAGNKWTLSKKFTIEKNESEKLKRATKFEFESANNKKLLLIIAVLLISVIIVGLILIRIKKPKTKGRHERPK